MTAENADADDGGSEQTLRRKRLNGQKVKSCCDCEFTKIPMRDKALKRHS
jgi:hypothetical protein